METNAPNCSALEILRKGVGNLILRANMLQANLRVLDESLKKPIKTDTVCSHEVAHVGRAALQHNFDDGLVVLRDDELHGTPRYAQ